MSNGCTEFSSRTTTGLAAEDLADYRRIDAGAKRPLQQTVYPERRNGRLTKRWVAEATLYGKRVHPRFDTLEAGKRWLEVIKHISAHEPQRETKKMDTLPVTRIPLPEDGKRVIRHLQSASEPFRSVRPPMLFEHVWTFLMVAVDEGRSVGEYAERAGVSNSVMSRHLLDLGIRNRPTDKGYGLIEHRPKPLELRKHEVYLTAQGRALAETLIWKSQT